MAGSGRCAYKVSDADLYFDRAAGELICWTEGATWRARSGLASLPPIPRNLTYGQQGRPFKDPLPAGMYFTDRRKLSVARSGRYNRRPFKDKKGFYWFLSIVRCDVKHKRGHRDDFGIHPDGKPPGTHGCIGLLAGDTKPIFETIKRVVHRKGRILIGVT